MTTAKILLVEDEGILALQIKNDLQNLGHTVVGIFASGEEALENIREASPDLVLMDIHLDGAMDGIETAEQISKLIDIPVIFLTAHSEETIIDRVKDTTPYGYLLKPAGSHELHISIQIALAKHSQDRKLKEMQRWLATVLRSTGEAIITTDSSLRITLMNPRAEEYTGWKTGEAIGKKLAEVLVMQAEGGQPRIIEDQIPVGISTGEHTSDYFAHHLVMGLDGHRTPVDGSAAPIRDEQDNIIGMVLTFRDVTERRRLELYRNLSNKVLEILNTTPEFQDAMEHILDAAQHVTGCDAVGIRLRNGDDFPYLAQRGFSDDFLRTENTLVAYNQDGNICQGPDGDVRLECTCGLVIDGKTDPTNPLFTASGSFWTNDASPLLHLPAAADPRFHPPNRCIHHGFTAIALVPIREKLRIVGLLQLNDRRKGGVFSLEAIRLLEEMANHIGEALLRRKAEAALQEAYDVLEKRVQKRTRELTTANELLMVEMDERKIIEKSLEIQRDIHLILSTSTMVLLFGKDRESVVRSICEVAVESGHFSLAWVGFLDGEGNVKVHSAAGPATHYLEGITITGDETQVSGIGPTGTSIRRNHTIINDDFATNPALTPWRERAIAHGLRSSVNIPIREGRKCIGTLSLYAPEPRFFTEENVALLEQLASNLSSALDLLNMEARAKTAVESLRLSEEKYRIVADNTYDWEFWLNPQGAYIYISPSCLRITGHSPEDFISNPKLITRLVHPEDLPRYLAHRHTAEFNAAHDSHLLFRIHRPDGQVRWIEHLCQPVFTTDGKYLGHRGSNRDITEQKKNETQILQSKKWLQSVFDGISEPLIFVDRKMTLKMVNFAATTYFHIAVPQDILGRPYCEVIGGRPQCDQCPIPSAVSEEKPLSFVRQGFIDPEKVEAITLFPITAENAEDSGAVIRISDITESKMMEKALVRTEKLASIGVLSAGIAHEINNPNNFIMFNIPVLRRYLDAVLPIVKEHAGTHPDTELFGMTFPEFEKDLGELTDSIESGSQRIKNIVGELKEFSSLDDHEKTIWGNPEGAINQALRLARVHLKDSVKRLDVDIPPGLPDTFFEVGRLEQVLVNILINAAHAADKAESRVSLSVKLEDRNPHSLVIEITDNGCGMKEESLTKIFDPFYTTKAPGVGTGLGLYVCYNLITKVGGRIDVQSRVGEGSTFRIHLLCK